MLDPPAAGLEAQFAAGFGQRVLLTVDTEEEFDWNAPFSSADHGFKHVPAIARFQSFCETLGVIPLYLVDWPIVQCDEATALLDDALKRGKAEIGLQLHPWVNPPHDEEVTTANSFAGNLPPELEKAKFETLAKAIEQRFGSAPLIYRAGRYGLGQHSADLIKSNGFAIDTSVRSNYDYSDRHGPDYSRHPLTPYWTDASRDLLELPLTTVFWGMLRKQGRMFAPLLKKVPQLAGLLARIKMLEKIPLTPEGVTLDEGLRGADMAIDDGLPLIVLSLHSPSLAPGFTPYVHNESDLDALYEWLRVMITYFDQQGVKLTSVAEIMRSIVR